MAARTPLQRQLADGPRPARATALDALELARKCFNEGRRLDIQALAAELGVSRVTLHRWVGTREQLLVEVLWVSADRALTKLWQEVQASDLTRSHTAEVFSRWAADVIAHPGIKRMQADEAVLMARLLTQDASEFQRRMIERAAEYLQDDFAAGRVTVDLTADELAYATVRLVESFVHTPAITGGAPDPARNARVLRALLR
ncbi:TetR/AcrR family transcriptional regulator [Pseudonocardia kujensis]|uniref:QsdR family transcriptional regulator n=1 Tax=Pseudonocardia kujensis TaxID=1128675 RepID=UPI001E47855E|nr:QsdR family transcriptional regulator [Pseudonocardia kujensis]MCE0764312.1 TetR/AcrR family transcriptional regulator [Pseudonocardia kujensis]